MAVAGGGNPHAAAPIPLSSKGVAPPSRPGYGAVGDRIVVRANHFLVRVADSDMIYLYDVNMNPTPKTRHINRVVISELAKLHREAHLGGLSFAYDGSKALYTAGKLPFESMDFKIKLGKDLREIEYKVTIRLAGQADLHHLHEFIAGRQRDSQQQTIQALDVVLRESPSLNYVTVYRSFFSTAFGREDIGDGLESWKGYYQSLRPTQMGLSLNIEGQRYFKKLNENQVTGLLKATCLPPQKREQKISEMVQHNNYPADRVVREFKIDISNQMATVPARVLPAPMLRYHDSGKEKTCYPRVGQWSMMNKKMVDGAKVQKWTCVSFARMQMDAVHRLCGELIYTCNATGMHFNQWPVMEVHSASPDNIEAALKNIHSVAPELELLIVILPDNSGYYGRIKRVCETELGIVSQCLKPGRKLWSFDRKYLENVSLKINVKTGGRNVVLQRPLLPGGLEDPTIIFGADVTHPAPGEDSAASIAAVVASMDWPEVTKYRALVSAQPARQEIIQDLFTMTETPLNTGCQQKADAQKKNIVCGGMIRDLLMAFYSKNAKRKPKRIIFYRDGVSDGQFYQVLLYEMDAIKKVIASMDSTYKPLVTFVVVQKRHHTRLFPEVHGRQDLTDKSGNIRPGTVVDTNICHPSEFDF
uniref:Piwi domain-containing protein n=1 Tax=Leersia perrieri TaxID=77586 RepID=A0A0D9WWC9_9ORYZ